MMTEASPDDATHRRSFTPRHDRRLKRVVRWARIMGHGAFLSAFLAVMVLSPAGRSWGWGLAALLGCLAWEAGCRLSTRPCRRREALWREPFPEPGRAFLEQREPYYQSLSAEEKERFIQGVKLFLDEVTVNVSAPEVSDEIRWHVASSAVMVFFGSPEWEWSEVGLREVILVPEVIPDGSREDDGIVTEYEESGFIGTEGILNGVVTLVIPDLQEDLDHPEDGVQVAAHEFAHLYDQAGRAKHLDPERWAACVKRDGRRIERGDSILDDYANVDENEFFAIGTEYFFTHPRRLRRWHPELYRLLADAYRQDTIVNWPAELTDPPEPRRRQRNRRRRKRARLRGSR